MTWPNIQRSKAELKGYARCKDCGKRFIWLLTDLGGWRKMRDRQCWIRECREAEFVYFMEDKTSGLINLSQIERLEIRVLREHDAEDCIREGDKRVLEKIKNELRQQSLFGKE